MRKYVQSLMNGIFPFAVVLIFVHLSNHGFISSLSFIDILLIINFLLLFPLARRPFMTLKLKGPITAFQNVWNKKNISNYSNVLPYNMLGHTPDGFSYSTALLKFFLNLFIFILAPILCFYGIYFVLRNKNIS